MILMVAQPLFTLTLTMLVALISYVPYMLFTNLFSRTTLHYVPVTVSEPSFAREESEVRRTIEPRKSSRKDDGFLSADDPRYIEMKSKK